MQRAIGAIWLLAVIAPLVCAQARLETTDLFRAGEGGYAVYRIPGVIVTAKGTILACCEGRRPTASDWGQIDLLVRRSADGGKTWEPVQKISEMPADAKRNRVAPKLKASVDGAITISNGTMIADRAGLIHFLYCVEYSRCFYRRSTDDGQTFSQPIEITATFEQYRKHYDWAVIATGPGHGIQLKSGRLIVPAWMSLGQGANGHSPSGVVTIYSDDAGKTWNPGDIVSIDRNHSFNETTIVELSDGAVMLNMRHPSEPHLRAVTTSAAGIGPWTDIRFDPALPDPVCMASMIRANPTTIVFSNPHVTQSRDRKNLTIKLSEDDGQTWPVMRVIEPGPSAYSDLAVGTDGKIYCFYERGETKPTECLRFARFDLDWVKLATVAPAARPAH